MARTYDFISYEPENGFVNVYDHQYGPPWYGSIHNREESDQRLRAVRDHGGRPLYRIRIRLKPDPKPSQEPSP